MSYTYQIRRYTSLAAAAALSACMLFGCTRADVSSSAQSVPNGTGSTGQSTVSGGNTANTLAGAGSSSAPGGQEENSAAAQTASGQEQQAAALIEGQTAQNVSGTTTQNTAQASGQAPAQAAASQPSAPQPAQDASQTPQPADAAQAVQQTDAALPQPQEQSAGSFVPEGSAVEAFTGEFEKNDGGETVVIALENDNLISFQFSTSGIGSVAQASGSTAVYYGEDGYSITFDVAGDTLGVTVNGEGGDQTVMNGIYYRVLEGGDDQADEEPDGEEPDWNEPEDTLPGEDGQDEENAGDPAEGLEY